MSSSAFCAAGDAVRQFVSYDVRGSRKAGEDHIVAVAEDHLLAVPERVVVVLAVMDRRDHGHAGVIDRIPVVSFEIEVERVSEAIVRLVDRDVAGRWLAFAPYEFSWQVLSVAGFVDTALLLGGSQ